MLSHLRSISASGFPSGRQSHPTMPFLHKLLAWMNQQLYNWMRKQNWTAIGLAAKYCVAIAWKAINYLYVPNWTEQELKVSQTERKLKLEKTVNNWTNLRGTQLVDKLMSTLSATLCEHAWKERQIENVRVTLTGRHTACVRVWKEIQLNFQVRLPDNWIYWLIENFLPLDSWACNWNCPVHCHFSRQSVHVFFRKMACFICCVGNNTETDSNLPVD